jgi:hypothetical protein
MISFMFITCSHATRAVPQARCVPRERFLDGIQFFVEIRDSPIDAVDNAADGRNPYQQRENSLLKTQQNSPFPTTK